MRLAAPIEPEWLLDRATSRTTLEWNRTAERVEQVTALVYDQLVIEETRAPAPASEEASKLLAMKALDVDIGRFVDREALDQLLARAAFAGIEIDVIATLGALCRGRTSFCRDYECCSAKLRPLAYRSACARKTEAARRAGSEGPLRGRQAAMDRIAASGFLRSARNSAHWIDSGCSAFARAEPQAGAGHQRSRRILGAALSAGAARAVAPISQAQVARIAVTDPSRVCYHNWNNKDLQ